MIGEIIKKTRLEKNLSLTKLANQAGVSKAYLCNLENNNQNNPSVNVARRIAKVLELDPPVLLDDGFREEAAMDQNESFFKLQKNIEDLHPNQLEELKNFIDFLLWKRATPIRNDKCL